MDLEERFSRWIQASIGAGAVDPFFMPTIQGLGHLDCEILDEDQRFNGLDQRARESVDESVIVTHRFTLSYLWVIGCYENLRTLHTRMKGSQKFSKAIVERAGQVKREFVRIRAPLTKMEPSDAKSDANSPIAYPALGPDQGSAWQIGPQTFVSRLNLSNQFLEFLLELRREVG